MSPKIQKLIVIKKMVADLKYPIQIVSVKTVREKSGLAISSRNQYLTKKEQLGASVLYKGLQKGQKLILQQKNINDIAPFVVKTYQHLRIDYMPVRQLSRKDTSFFKTMAKHKRDYNKHKNPKYFAREIKTT